MALPFTDEQRSSIRARLIKSARRYAIAPGVRKTSLEMLTADAGISKSSFYKFYESKELLFLEVAGRLEQQILESARKALQRAEGESDKVRAAAMVYGVFKEIHEMGAVRFLHEDLPVLSALVPDGQARAHFLSSADMIYAFLREENICFTAPGETVRSVIALMYLSILNIGDVGDGFFPALQELVAGACDRLIAE